MVVVTYKHAKGTVVTMAETDKSANVEEILLAQALAQMNKSQNRVKTSALLVALVSFANSGDTSMQHFEQKYPTVSVARLRTIIKANDVLRNRVWPIQNDDFGIVLVNVQKAQA
jgi:hypothetical protein